MPLPPAQAFEESLHLTSVLESGSGTACFYFEESSIAYKFQGLICCCPIGSAGNNTAGGATVEIQTGAAGLELRVQRISGGRGGGGECLQSPRAGNHEQGVPV